MPPVWQALTIPSFTTLMLSSSIGSFWQSAFSEDEIRGLFRLLTRFPEGLKIDWEKTKPEIISKYQRLGCKLGDAVVAAHLEELDIKILVSENRDFLEEVRDLPFRRLSAAQALAELEQGEK